METGYNRIKNRKIFDVTSFVTAYYFPQKPHFEPHFEQTKRAVEICKILGTDNIRMFSFFTEDLPLGEVKDEVFARLKKMVEYGKENGVRFCHENESNIYGQMPGEVRDLLTEIGELGGIFDPANYRMNNADVIDGIEATLINFKYLHIKDAIYDAQAIVPAGEGEGRIAEIIDRVNEHTDALVYLTLEPHLHIFDAYKDIDEHELKGKYSFNSNREAFDFAVNALAQLLNKNGYVKDENGIWKK